MTNSIEIPLSFDEDGLGFDVHLSSSKIDHQSVLVEVDNEHLSLEGRIRIGNDWVPFHRSLKLGEVLPGSIQVRSERDSVHIHLDKAPVVH